MVVRLGLWLTIVKAGVRIHLPPAESRTNLQDVTGSSAD
jgi:hypothetical protein